MLQWTSRVFATGKFKGSPAATVLLNDWIEHNEMQSIATKNNFAETTFVKYEDGFFNFRWFTPIRETYLAGHASIAALGVLRDIGMIGNGDIYIKWKDGFFRSEIEKESIWLYYNSELIGNSYFDISINRIISKYRLDAEFIFLGKDLTLVLSSEDQVSCFDPEHDQLKSLKGRGLCVTSLAKIQTDYSYVSRFFAPKYGVFEDGVTLTSHVYLSSYWSGILGKKHIKCAQIGIDGGIIRVNILGDELKIGGNSSIITTY